MNIIFMWKSINTHKDINLYYKNGIEKIIKNINIKFDVSEKIYLDIKLDKFGGENKQLFCIYLK